MLQQCLEHMLQQCFEHMLQVFWAHVTTVFWAHIITVFWAHVITVLRAHVTMLLQCWEHMLQQCFEHMLQQCFEHIYKSSFCLNNEELELLWLITWAVDVCIVCWTNLRRLSAGSVHHIFHLTYFCVFFICWISLITISCYDNTLHSPPLLLTEHDLRFDWLIGV